MAVIGGNAAGAGAASGNDFVTQAFSAFAIGAASGYGSHKVFKWLDGHINRWFQISEVEDVIVPELKDKMEQEAKDALQKLELNVKVVQLDSSDESQINKVVWQSPPAGTKVPKASSVDIIVAKKPVVEVVVPNLKDNTEQQAKDALEKLGLKFNVEPGVSRDANETGKVIKQSPSADTKVTKGSEVTITIAKKKE